MDTIKADEIINSTIRSGNLALGKHLKGDVLFFCAELDVGVDDFIRDEVEHLAESKEKADRLVVVLETPGGYIESVERIVAVFRRHYKLVDFVIPNYAYSAGTVLALSGDEIYMDYYSVLGPIDPQFRTGERRQVPGMGYIAKYRELLTEINEVNEEDISSKKAELAFLIRKFDPAELFRIEQSMRHSESLIMKWLPKYKFKNWKKTETQGLRVSRKMRVDKAKAIAEILGNAEEWHSHGRGISKQDLESDKIGLKVIDFGASETTNSLIRHYYGLCRDFMVKIGIANALHSRSRLRRIL